MRTPNRGMVIRQKMQMHPGNPAHRATFSGAVVNGCEAWRCSCGDTIFVPLTGTQTSADEVAK